MANSPESLKTAIKLMADNIRTQELVLRMLKAEEMGMDAASGSIAFPEKGASSDGAEAVASSENEGPFRGEIQTAIFADSTASGSVSQGLAGDPVSQGIAGQARNDVKSTKPEKMPWGVVVALAVLCALSLGTGVFYWYRNYFRQDDFVPVTPPFVDDRAGQEQDVNDAPDNNFINVENGAIEPPIAPPRPRPNIDPRPEFVALWEQYGNDDIVGHLFIEGTELDKIVVQSSDNQFYLTHNIWRAACPYGWVFLDYQVDLIFGDDHNMVIYAPGTGVLRNTLRRYREYEFFLTHPVITFDTLYGSFEWEIFSFYVAPGDFPFRVINHPTDEAWGDAVEFFTEAAWYNTMLDVTQYDQVLTLTAPTDTDPNLFYVLQARMLRHITS